MDFCYIFLINSLAFYSLNAIEVAVSTKSLPWQDAANGERHELLDLEYVLQHGWDSLSNVSFDDEGLWVAARAKYAPPVSWEGCARWKPSCVSDHVTAGSLGDCLKNCQGDSKYMLLKGDKCRCFEKSETCIQRTYDPCDDHCRNNPNDWCGGEFGTGALYYTGPFKNITYNETKYTGRIYCIVLIKHNKLDDSKESLFGQNCETTTTRRLICKGNSKAFEGDNSVPKNWFEALEVCKKFSAHIYFDLPTNNVTYNRSAYWTSLRRGLNIKWTKGADTEYPFCVFFRHTIHSNLMLYAGDCNMRKKCLYLTGRNENTRSSDDGKYNYWLIGPLVFLAICLPSVGLACYISGRRSKEKLNFPPARYNASRRQTTTRPLSPQLGARPHPNRIPDNVTIECDYDYVTVANTDFCDDDKFSKLEPHYSATGRVQNRPDSLYDNKTLPSGRLDDFISPNVYNTIDCGYGGKTRSTSGKPQLSDEWSQSLDRKCSSKPSSKPFFHYELAKY